MKLLADENVERPIVASLRAHGHQVTSIAELAPGITDTEVLELANQEEELLVTADKDFGDLIFQRHYQIVGVILVRLPDSLSSLEKSDIIANVVKIHGNALLHSFTVITSNKVRITKLFPT